MSGAGISLLRSGFAESTVRRRSLPARDMVDRKYLGLVALAGVRITHFCDRGFAGETILEPRRFHQVISDEHCERSPKPVEAAHRRVKNIPDKTHKEERIKRRHR